MATEWSEVGEDHYYRFDCLKEFFVYSKNNCIINFCI